MNGDDVSIEDVPKIVEIDDSVPWNRGTKEMVPVQDFYQLSTLVIAVTTGIVALVLLRNLIPKLSEGLSEQISVIIAIPILACISYWMSRKSYRYYFASISAGSQEYEGRPAPPYETKIQHVDFKPVGFLKCFFGGGKAEFSDEGLILSGTLTSQHFLFPYFTLGILVLGRMARYAGMNREASLCIGVIAIVALFLFQRKTTRECAKTPFVVVKAMNIKKVQCNGPFVTLRFSNPPTARLYSVRFYIPSWDRERFFSNFDKHLPHLLPEKYSDAVARLQNTDP